MELSIMLVGLALLVVFVGPVIAVIIVQARKDRKLKEWLSRVEMDQELEFLRKEIYKGRGIALDEARGVFVFLHQSANDTHCEVVDLRPVKECKFVKNFNVDTEDEVSELHFVFSDPKLPARVVGIFIPDMDNYLNLPVVQRIGVQWVECINAVLKTRALSPGVAGESPVRSIPKEYDRTG